MKRKIAILLIIVLGIGLVYFSPEKKEKDPFFVNKKVKTKKVNVLKMDESIKRLESTKFRIYKDNILKWENGKLYIRNLSKEGLSYNIALNANDPIILPGDNTIFFANKDEGIIYFLDEKAEMKERIQLGKPIYRLKQFKDNLVYHVKSGQNEEIGVINSKGQSLMRYEYKGENILDYSYDPKKRNLTVSVLEVYDKGMTSRLEFYEKLSEKRSKDFLNFEGEVIVKLDYTELGNVVALTDDNLYYISEGKIAWNKDLNIVRDYHLKGRDIYLLHSNYLTILDNKGDEKENIALTEEYSNVLPYKSGFLKEEVILYSDQLITILKNGEEFLSQKQPISQIDFYEDTIFILDQEKYGFYKKDKEDVEVKEEEG